MSDGPYFVLIHGAYHSAWCWDVLRPELERRGAAAIAIDLPGDPGAGAEEYAAAVTAAVPHGRGPVVVVGHSLAGLTLPLPPRTLDVERLVYLCARAPQPGVSFDDQNADMGTGFAPRRRRTRIPTAAPLGPSGALSRSSITIVLRTWRRGRRGRFARSTGRSLAR